MRLTKLVAALSALGVAACSSSTAPPNSISISIAPGTAALRIGLTQEFSVSLSGVENTDVSWETTCGSIEGTGSTVTFTAPWTVGDCVVTVRSQASPGRSASATVNVTRTGLGPNLLPNPDFATDLREWGIILDGGVPRAVWNAEDVGGDVASGSVRVSHPAPGNNGHRIGLTVCLPSAPGVRYVYGGAARLTQELEGAIPSFLLWSFVNSTCTQLTPNEGRLGLNFESSGEWRVEGASYTTPEETAYLAFHVTLRKNTGVNNEAFALFDDLFVYQED